MELLMLSTLIFAVGVVWFIISLVICVFRLLTISKENCIHCGKPFRCFSVYIKPLCKKCRREYKKALCAEIRKQPKTTKCTKCNGTGKIKKYKCTKCNGKGLVYRDKDNILQSAQEIIKNNVLWKDFFEVSTQQSPTHLQTTFIEELFTNNPTKEKLS